MFIVRRAVLVIWLFSLLLLSSCGGHSGASSSDSRHGTARFTIQWPERPTRLIPLGSASIRVTLAGPTSAIQVVARLPGGATTSTLTFPDLAPGDYNATATAYPSADATGTAQAVGTTVLSITDDQTTATSLTMGSTIARIELSLSGPTRMGVGASRTITASAKDATNATVLVHPSQWEWQNSNSTDFTFTPNQSTATISVPGQSIATTTVTVKDRESQVTTSINLTSTGILFEGIGIFPNGGFASLAWGVSGDGTVITGRGSVNGSSHAFQWTSATGMVDIFPPSPERISTGIAVSKSGNAIVGYASNEGTQVSYQWTTTGGIDFFALPTNGMRADSANDTSEDGSVIIGDGFTVARGNEAFRWTRGTGVVGLGDLPGGPFYSSARASSQDGNAIVGYSSAANNLGSRAFYWTPSTGMIRLSGLPENEYSVALDISDNGAYVAGYIGSPENFRTFRWSPTHGAIYIEDLPGGNNDLRPSGISGDGSIIVGMGTTSTGEEPFLWAESPGLQNLHDFLRTRGVDLTGWQTLYVTDISADGKTIVGYAMHGDHFEGFRIYKPDGFQNP